MNEIDSSRGGRSPSSDPGPGLIKIGPDPLWDCPKGRRKQYSLDDIRPYFILEIIELILALSDVYATISGNKSNTPEMLRAIDGKLDEIKAKLDIANEKITEVIVMLKQLPEIIRGEIVDSLVASELGGSRATVGQIQDRLKNVDANKHLIEERCDTLDHDLGMIAGLKGIAGALVVSPYLSVWLPAMVAVEKAKKRADPTYSIDSPWGRDFVKRTRHMVQMVFDNLYKMDREFWKLEFPNHTDSYDLRDGAFHRNTFHVIPSPGQPPSPPLQYGEYKFLCPTSSHDEKLLQRQEHGNYVPVYSGSGYDAWRDLMRVRNEMAAFYNTVPAIWDAKQRILDVFVEPDGMWDATN